MIKYALVASMAMVLAACGNAQPQYQQAQYAPQQTTQYVPVPVAVPANNSYDRRPDCDFDDMIERDEDCGFRKRHTVTHKTVVHHVVQPVRPVPYRPAAYRPVTTTKYKSPVYTPKAVPTSASYVPKPTFAPTATYKPKVVSTPKPTFSTSKSYSTSSSTRSFSTRPTAKFK